MTRPLTSSTSYLALVCATEVVRGPGAGGWSDIERLKMVQPQTLSKKLTVEKLSYVGSTSSRSQDTDNTGAVRHKAVPRLNFMVTTSLVSCGFIDV